MKRKIFPWSVVCFQDHVNKGYGRPRKSSQADVYQPDDRKLRQEVPSYLAVSVLPSISQHVVFSAKAHLANFTFSANSAGKISGDFCRNTSLSTTMSSVGSRVITVALRTFGRMRAISWHAKSRRNEKGLLSSAKPAKKRGVLILNWAILIKFLATLPYFPEKKKGKHEIRGHPKPPFSIQWQKRLGG